MQHKLRRSLHKGMKGPDVKAIKRALKKAGYGRGLKFDTTFGPIMFKQVKKFQGHNGLGADGVYGQKTHDKLWKYFDEYGKGQMAKAPLPDPRAEKFNGLLAYCYYMTQVTPGYRWGGGHNGRLLADVSPTEALDCSSSCSKALNHEGFLKVLRSLVSSDFEYYGDGGTGEFFTIYANYEHVWIKFHKGPWDRFDTSPHGDGGRGPRLRKVPRFTRGFVARHYPNY